MKPVARSRLWATAAFGVLGCADMGSNDDVQSSDLTPSDAADHDSDGPPDGKALYDSQCASCHGGDGTGTVIGPTIRYVPKAFGEYTVRHGRDKMPFAVPMGAYPDGSLDAESLGLILDHLHTLVRPTTGAELFGMLCANCHGPDGHGGRVGKSLVGEARDLSEKVREGEAGSNYGRSNFMPGWPKAELSNAELAAIKAHVDSF